MEEPVRLVCPDCQLVYRIKRLTLGKNYNCKSCGAGLRSLEPLRLTCPSCGAVTEAKEVDVSNPPHCELCEGAPPLSLPLSEEERIARSNADASSSAHSAIPTHAGARRQPAVHAGGDLARLPRLIEKLSADLESFRLAQAEEDAATDENNHKLMEATVGLAESLRTLNDKLLGDVEGLGEKVTLLLATLDGGELQNLSDRLLAVDDRMLERLDLLRDDLKQGMSALVPAAPDADEAPPVTVDIDALAERLVAGVRRHAPRLDEESDTAIDALGRVAEGLVREQNENTMQLGRLAEEIRRTSSNLAALDEWRSDLPNRVADEIGRSVEDRVVGPLTGALARQAPAILSDLQGNKLFDIVSRSVREAQRPLLREVLTGGRSGVPAWLFAAVLIPLLLVLGYLFLPGELGFSDDSARIAAIADGIDRLEQTGVPLIPETEDRLAAIEEVVANIHGEAMTHVKNAATLEEEVRNLKRELEGSNKLIEEYKETLQRQVRRLRAYETRLNRLGVSPDSIPD